LLDTGALVGPYDLKLNGLSAITAACISVNQHISLNETWTATEESIFDPSDFTAAQTTDLQQAAWLDSVQFPVYAANPSGNAAAITAIQQAIWDLGELEQAT